MNIQYKRYNKHSADLCKYNLYYFLFYIRLPKYTNNIQLTLFKTYIHKEFMFKKKTDLYYVLGKFSRQQADDIFLIFPKKIGFDIIFPQKIGFDISIKLSP